MARPKEIDLPLPGLVPDADHPARTGYAATIGAWVGNLLRAAASQPPVAGGRQPNVTATISGVKIAFPLGTFPDVMPQGVLAASKLLEVAVSRSVGEPSGAFPAFVAESGEPGLLVPHSAVPLLLEAAFPEEELDESADAIGRTAADSKHWDGWARKVKAGLARRPQSKPAKRPRASSPKPAAATPKRTAAPRTPAKPAATPLRPAATPAQPASPRTSPRPAATPAQPASPRTSPRPAATPAQPASPRTSPRPATTPAKTASHRTASRPTATPLKSASPQTGPVFFWLVDELANPYRVFSNWFSAPFTDTTVSPPVMYDNVEQYLMAAKATVFRNMNQPANDSVRASVMATTNPQIIKALGRKVQGFGPGLWDGPSKNAVFTACYLKFSQHRELGDLLVSTGDRVLAEAAPNDAIWGIKLSAKDAAETDPGSWPGENRLGRILMQVRKQLRDERAGAPPPVLTPVQPLANG